MHIYFDSRRRRAKLDKVIRDKKDLGYNTLAHISVSMTLLEIRRTCFGPDAAESRSYRGEVIRMEVLTRHF